MLLPYFILVSYGLLIAFAYEIYGKRFKANYITNVFITLYIVFVTGIREVIPYTDTDNYQYYFTFIDSLVESSEIAFYSLMLAVKYFTNSFTIFLLVIAFIYYLCLNYSIAKYAKYYNINYYLGYLVFLSMFFNYSLSMNVMRQGLSVAFLLVAIAINYGQKNKLGSRKKALIVILLLLAFFSHHSSLIFILCLLSVIILKKIKLKHYYLLFGLSIVISYLNQSDPLGISGLVASLGDSSNYGRYGEIQTDYSVGFKLQFVAFNAFCLLLAGKLYKSKLYKDGKYEILLKAYILLSSIFFIFSAIPYSDRIGIYSWILIPYLLMPYLSYNYKYPKTLIIIGLVVLFYALNPQFFN